MKNKYLYIILIMSGISILVAVNYFDVLSTSMLYIRIQYNGIDYYIGDDAEVSIHKQLSGRKLMAHIVDGIGIIDYKHPREAHPYVGDNECKYLLFDSATFTRIDQLSPERMKQYKIKIADVEKAKRKLSKAKDGIDTEQIVDITDNRFTYRLLQLLIVLLALITCIRCIYLLFMRSQDNGFIIRGHTLLKYVGTSTYVAIPENVYIIGKYAFSGNKRIKKMFISKHISRISSGAFINCKNLESINFEENRVPLFICSDAFMSCKSLREITLPNAMEGIAPLAFVSCTSLEKVTINEFPLMDYSFGASFDTIPYHAFLGCDNLKEVIIPNSIKYISSHAFYGCKSLESITISEQTILAPDANEIDMQTGSMFKVIYRPVGDMADTEVRSESEK